MFVSRWLLFISLPFFSFSLMSGKKEKRKGKMLLGYPSFCLSVFDQINGSISKFHLKFE